MSGRLWIFLRVLVPLFILGGIDLWPVPRSVVVNLAQARTYDKGGRPVESAESRIQVLAVHPYRHLEEWIALGLARGKDYARAADYFEAAQLRSGLSPAGLESWADALENSGNFEKALAVWTDAARVSLSAEPYRRSALIFRKLSRYSDALISARQWQAQAPWDPQAAYLICLLSAADNPEAARDWLELAADLNKIYQPANHSFRQVFGQMGLRDTPAYRLVLMGRWLAGQDAWDLAEDAFQQSVEVSPGYAEAWALLGQSKLELGQQNGLADLIHAVEINPQSVLAHAVLGSYYARKEDFSKAIQELQTVSALEPDQAVWQVELGNFFAAYGNLMVARGYFAAARELEPANPLVWEATAQFSLNYGVELRDLGLPSARRVIMLLGDDPVGYDLVGRLMMELGDLRSAERFLQQALMKQPDYAPAHLHLGQMYLQLSEVDRAGFHLKQAVHYDLNGETAKIARRLLERYLGEG